MVVFGKNILENLTTGMYPDARVIYREYIQNACDAIDTAIENGLLCHGEERIDIVIDLAKRSIEITDNGIGIPKADFVRVLSDIANSDKDRGKNKGFRGIGRLCGLAYCQQLQFITTAKGEDITSTMTWDARKMRTILNDTQKHSADEVLSEILSTNDADHSEPDDHFFKIIMTGIKKESRTLLDTDKIRDYLSFEVPVPYDTSFIFCSQIYEHARSLGVSIDEYRIFVNNEQVLKKYRTYTYASGKQDDEIQEIAFKEFYDENENLLAWMWFGLSTLKRQIKPENSQRGLRLRKDNIQIGTSKALRDQNLFPDGRANEYFIGEVFAIHPDLIPNARRDYFNENPTRATFEALLRDFFVILWKLCNIASEDRSAYKSIQEYHSTYNTYKVKAKSGFNGNVDRETLQSDLAEKKTRAEKAIQKLKRPLPEDDSCGGLATKVKRIVRAVEDKKVPDVPLPNLPSYVANNNSDKERKDKPKYLSNELSQYSKETRKVISRIYDLISENAPDIAQKLIAKIHAGLKSKKD